MKCSPEFRKRAAEQAELARRKAGRGYTGQLFFTYGEVKWILADLADLAARDQAISEIPYTRPAGGQLTDVDSTTNPQVIQQPQ